MSAIGTLRTAVNTLLSTAEARTLGVLDATERAASAFLTVITDAVRLAATQIVSIAFTLANTVVEEAFNVAGSAVNAALGEVQDDEEGS